MKSIVLASIAIVIGMAAFTASAIAASGHHHEQGEVSNFTCTMCKGTGRAGGTGNTRCIFCKGSGWNGSY